MRIPQYIPQWNIYIYFHIYGPPICGIYPYIYSYMWNISTYIFLYVEYICGVYIGGSCLFHFSNLSYVIGIGAIPISRLKIKRLFCRIYPAKETYMWSIYRGLLPISFFDSHLCDRYWWLRLVGFKLNVSFAECILKLRLFCRIYLKITSLLQNLSQGIQI